MTDAERNINAEHDFEAFIRAEDARMLLGLPEGLPRAFRGTMYHSDREDPIAAYVAGEITRHVERTDTSREDDPDPPTVTGWSGTMRTLAFRDVREFVGRTYRLEADHLGSINVMVTDFETFTPLGDVIMKFRSVGAPIVPPPVPE
jgi:hypothetical protein